MYKQKKKTSYTKHLQLSLRGLRHQCLFVKGVKLFLVHFRSWGSLELQSWCQEVILNCEGVYAEVDIPNPLILSHLSFLHDPVHLTEDSTNHFLITTGRLDGLFVGCRDSLFEDFASKV